jgi:DNA-binding transcriptional ArsR family regulator
MTRQTQPLRVRSLLIGAGLAGSGAVLAVWTGAGCAVLGGLGVSLGMGPLAVATCATVGCACGGGVAALGARRSWWTRLLALAPAIPLWTRFSRADVALHPARAGILDHVRRQPGATTRETALALSMNEGTFAYHARFLERARYVKSRRVGRDRVWYESGALVPDAGHAEALHARARVEILAAVRDAPGCTQADLARTLRMPRTTLNHHVKRLVDAGLLRLEREGLRTRCYCRLSGESLQPKALR